MSRQQQPPMTSLGSRWEGVEAGLEEIKSAFDESLDRLAGSRHTCAGPIAWRNPGQSVAFVAIALRPPRASAILWAVVSSSGMVCDIRSN